MRLEVIPKKKHQIRCEDYDLLLRLYASGYKGMNLSEVLLDYSINFNRKVSRNVKFRWNEVVTRWSRFRDLNLLPGVLPFVVKPLVVLLVPEKILRKIKGYGTGY